MNQHTQIQTKPETSSFSPSPPLAARTTLLQRKCACGGTPGLDGECAECRRKRLGFQGLLDQPEVSRYSPEVDAGQPAPTQSPLPRALVGSRFGHHFANVRIFSETSANVGPKLTVNEPGDANEQEADRIADGLVSIPAGSTAVRLSSSADRGPQVPVELADQIARLQRGGSPLSTQERAHFEPRLGHNFSRVRIHTDTPAAESARMLGAYAYTAGQDIFFAAGHYSPGTPAGRRLLAHELVHVAQQSGEAPTATIQRQPAGAPIHAGQEPQRVDPSVLAQVPPEKWSEVIEYQYRLRGDSERANAIRACRTKGVEACRWILMPSEVREAHERLVRERLNLAKRSGGDEGAIWLGTAAAPLARGGVEAAEALGRTPAAVASRASHLSLVTAASETAAAAEVAGAGVGGVAAETTAGAAVSTGATTLAGAAALAGILAIAGYQLWTLGRVQAELRDAGYIILEDPQALCTGGCHLPDLPDHPISPDVPSQPRWDPRELPPWMVERPPQAARQTPSTRTARTTPSPYTGPRVGPEPEAPEESTRRRCISGTGPSLGEHNCHAAFAMSISGVPREFTLRTPEGKFESFDALGPDGVLYEVKTGHLGLVYNKNMPRRQERIDKFVRQSENQLEVATRCGYKLVWVFNEPDVQQFFDYLQPKTTYQVFPCKIDSE